ncbi:adenosylmethionine decarboxylase proenzyme [Aquimarina sp. MAR_2010_214]|uniref:adenosylmethionine decarboxylase n=1 Tax=Aquimarina sp. MAR_2010_214 TaxID=1250026 RepID=UPI000C714B03|nr:adenosylmethionine decarboxylase [Aquimarina sp. MAR_2010_214]PKV48032.1 adenosylmethionine decarboxylase proenzyme [Aquimarina sp. MAR_2010_214]
MNGLGLHILMEFHECSVDILDKLDILEVSMDEAATVAGATIIKSVFHQFAPQGVTGVVVIAESHLAIHTWPEYGYAAVDFFTCNTDMDYLLSYQLLAEKLKSKRHSYKSVERGLINNIAESN